jgi:hypothetical protein
MTVTLFAPDFYVDQQPGPGYDPKRPIRVPATMHLHNDSDHAIDLSGTGRVRWSILALDTGTPVATGDAPVPDQIVVGASDTYALEFLLEPPRGAFAWSGSHRLVASFFRTAETRVEISIVV